MVDIGIPREVIDAARFAIKDNVRSRNTGDRVYQLTGLIRCSGCGYLMGTNRRAGNGKTYHYYRCSNHQRYGSRVCTMNKNFPADDLERTVLHAVLDAVKNRDELIRRANEKFEQEKASILRLGSVSSAEWHRNLEPIDRQRANYQRAFAADKMSLDDLAARTAELDAAKAHVERLLTEHENRANRLKALEETRDKAVAQIRRGSGES